MLGTTGYYANSAIDTVLDLAMGAPSEAEAIAFWQSAQWDGETGFTTPQACGYGRSTATDLGRVSV